MNVARLVSVDYRLLRGVCIGAAPGLCGVFNQQSSPLECFLTDRLTRRSLQWDQRERTTRPGPHSRLNGHRCTFPATGLSLPARTCRAFPPLADSQAFAPHLRGRSNIHTNLQLFAGVAAKRCVSSIYASRATKIKTKNAFYSPFNKH